MTPECLKPIIDMILDVNDLNSSIQRKIGQGEREPPQLVPKSDFTADLKQSVLHQIEDKWAIVSQTNETLNRGFQPG